MPVFLTGKEADLLEAVPDAIVVVDGYGFIVFINATAQGLFGYAERACLGQPVEMLLPDRYRGGHEAVRQSFAAAHRRRLMPDGQDLSARKRDGQEIPVDIALGSMQADDRALVIAVIRDVSDRRRAEDSLRRSEGRYRRLAEHADDIIFRRRFAEPPGTEYVNPAVEAVLGYRPEEFYADPDLMLRAVHPDDRAAFLAFRRDPGSFRATTTHRFIAKTGETKWIEARASLIHDDNGVPVAIQGVARDVTEQRRALALEVELRAAHESERLKDALLSTMSHELRTPISVIRGYATLAIDYANRLDRGDVTQYLRDIDRYAQQLERLVADLLTMSRIEAGALVIDPKPADVASLISESVEAFTVAGGKREVNVSVSPPGVTMMVDPERIRQVLFNLFDNADKYSEPDTSIDVVAEVNADQVRVQVRDHGGGVPKEDLDRIFGRFYQVDARTSVRGTGLGLAICRSIIEAQGGSIDATLPADGGLEITLLLPSA
jgi:protein-histidine pros-kinase